MLGEQVTFKALAAATAGGYTLFELRTAPGAGRAPHLQHHEDETFFVLEGTYSALIGEERVELGPGSYVFMPRGTVHAFTNIGTSPARMLIMITPGGNHERFLTEIGEPIEDPARYTPGLSASGAQIALAAAKYGVEFFAAYRVFARGLIPACHTRPFMRWRGAPLSYVLMAGDRT